MMELEKWEVKAILVACVLAALLPVALIVAGLVLKVEWAAYLLLGLGSLALFGLCWLLLIGPVENFFEKREIAPKK